jgi:hypothetical protein
VLTRPCGAPHSRVNSNRDRPRRRPELFVSPAQTRGSRVRDAPYADVGIVRPAQLPTLGRDLVVGRQAVGHPDSGEVRPHQTRERLSIAPTVDPVDSDPVSDTGPQPVEETALLPRRLVDVRQAARAERPESFVKCGLERTRDAVLDVADRAHRHRDAERLRRQTRRLAASQAIASDQCGRQSL